MPATLRSDAALLRDIRRLGGQSIAGDAGTFWAIFDNAYESDVDTEVRVPMLTARTSDVEALRKGAQFTIGSEVYRMRRQEPDGTGLSTIYLEQ